MFDPFVSLFNSPVFHVLVQIYNILSSVAFIWAPIILVWLTQHLWLEYRRMLFIQKNFEFISLEVKVPRVIDKTPLAMELALHAFLQGRPYNWYEKWWVGEVKPWFSLEIVSLEGNVKFFIRTPSKFKKVIESSLYAHYPDIEIHEVKDYVSLAPYIHAKDEWTMSGCTFYLAKPDPYPIKTYIDYGLDSTMTKEEIKSDPLSSHIEFLGSLGRGQFMWFQTIIQATNDRFKTPGTWFGHHDWKDEGKKVVKELQEMYAGEVGTRATKRQTEVIQAIERSLGKPGFDCGMRAVYIARKENFDGSNVAGMRGAMRPFGSMDLNALKSSGTAFNYPWQDWNNLRQNRKKHKLFDAYVRRSWFYAPHKKKPFVLNTEELATIFHFPGGVSETPTFSRIESRKGEPPANLPI
jgi:hypothetical protein